MPTHDNTEVEIMETADMGETDFRSFIEGDRKYRQDDLGPNILSQNKPSFSGFSVR